MPLFTTSRRKHQILKKGLKILDLQEGHYFFSLALDDAPVRLPFVYLAPSGGELLHCEFPQNFFGFANFADEDFQLEVRS